MTEAEYQRREKYEQKQMRYDNERLKVLETCKFLVCSDLIFGMDHINVLKVKYLRVLLCYHYGSVKLKGIPKKVGLVGAVEYIFRKDWDNIVQIWVDGVSVVKS